MSRKEGVLPCFVTFSLHNPGPGMLLRQMTRDILVTGNKIRRLTAFDIDPVWCAYEV